MEGKTDNTGHQLAEASGHKAPSSMKATSSLGIIDTSKRVEDIAGVPSSSILATETPRGREYLPPAWKLSSSRPFTVVKATETLGQGEMTSPPNNTGAELRVKTDAITLGSSLPNEDHFPYGKIDAGDRKRWLYWGLYDGHGFVTPIHPH